MARRCLCARLLAAVKDDPRLRTMPLAARALFLLLADAAAAGVQFGVLPFSGTGRVSLLVSAPETDVGTHLETLVTEGLVVRTDAGGLAVPLLADAAPKAEAARRNGAAGGRPRRGETPEQARARRQGEMLLPIPGVAAAEKPTETQSENPVSSTTTSLSLSPSVKEGGSAREAVAADFVALGDEIAEIAGMDPARGRFDFGRVKGWLQAGSTPDSIRAAVRRAVASPGYRPGKAFSLGYFDAAVERERSRPVEVAPGGDTAEDRARIAETERMIEAVLSGRRVAA